MVDHCKTKYNNIVEKKRFFLNNAHAVSIDKKITNSLQLIIDNRDFVPYHNCTTLRL
jgi:hypothetical protein